MRQHLIAAVLLSGVALAAARAETIAVVAAENVYGDIVRQIGGADVAVATILNRPDQDPHLFETSAATARQVAAARLVVYNGAGYDPWMVKLLAASKAPGRAAIEVAGLVGKGASDNPHVWYEPRTMPAFARALAETLSKLDPSHAAAYAERLAAFLASLKPLDDKIGALRRTYAGTPITATEPVFGYMAAALGLAMRNLRFQLSVMNETEPSASDIAAFERDLKTGAVKVLVYNSQTGGPLAERMRTIATEAGVPVVGVTETKPEGKTYQEWMMSQLAALEQALQRK